MTTQQPALVNSCRRHNNIQFHPFPSLSVRHRHLPFSIGVGTCDPDLIFQRVAVLVPLFFFVAFVSLHSDNVGENSPRVARGRQFYVCNYRSGAACSITYIKTIKHTIFPSYFCLVFFVSETRIQSEILTVHIFIVQVHSYQGIQEFCACLCTRVGSVKTTHFI